VLIANRKVKRNPSPEGQECCRVSGLLGATATLLVRDGTGTDELCENMSRVRCTTGRSDARVSPGLPVEEVLRGKASGYDQAETIEI
jgi:hypothetical protein